MWVSHCPSRPGPKSQPQWAPGQHAPSAGSHVLDLMIGPGPGQTVPVGRGRGPGGPGWVGPCPCPNSQLQRMDVGQSQVLPGKRSSSTPCPTEIPLFLASQLLSDKVHVDLRAVGQDNCLLQTTETSKGGPPTPQTSLGSQDVLGRGSRPEMEGQSSEPSGEWGLPGGGTEGAQACVPPGHPAGPRRSPHTSQHSQNPTGEGPGAHSPSSLPDAPLHHQQRL